MARPSYSPDSVDDRASVTRKMSQTYPNLKIHSMDYYVYRGGSSNKYHMFVLAKDSAGRWYALNAYGRIGGTPNLNFLAGPTSEAAATSALASHRSKKTRKGYSQWNAEELSVQEPFKTGFKITLGVISGLVVGSISLGALGLILTGLGNGDE